MLLMMVEYTTRTPASSKVCVSGIVAVKATSKEIYFAYDYLFFLFGIGENFEQWNKITTCANRIQLQHQRRK